MVGFFVFVCLLFVFTYLFCSNLEGGSVVNSFMTDESAVSALSSHQEARLC